MQFTPLARAWHSLTGRAVVLIRERPPAECPFGCGVWFTCGDLDDSHDIRMDLEARNLEPLYAAGARAFLGFVRDFHQDSVEDNPAWTPADTIESVDANIGDDGSCELFAGTAAAHLDWMSLAFLMDEWEWAATHPRPLATLADIRGHSMETLRGAGLWPSRSIAPPELAADIVRHGMPGRWG
jgi:hypothetical protein